VLVMRRSPVAYLAPLGWHCSGSKQELAVGYIHCYSLAQGQITTEKVANRLQRRPVCRCSSLLMHDHRHTLTIW
jgi:hypothetical protein